MSDALDAYIERTQKIMDEAALKRFGPKVVARWINPLFMSEMLAPTCVGSAMDPGYGDTVTLYLKLDGQTISQAAFMASGCGPTIVCGDAAAELAQGKTLEEAAKLGMSDILHLLETLPEDKHRSATLAIAALHGAVAKGKQNDA